MTPANKIAAREARRQFELVARQPDAAIDLAQAALLVALEEEPRFELSHLRARVYEMGVEARARVERLERQGGEPVLALNDFLFNELGFTGNEENYYDVRNSLLNHVVERRTGIPITLSIIYMEVGRRAGLHTEGVSLPGHFIVRVRPDADSWQATLVDPFHRQIVDREDCQQRLDTIYGGQVRLTEEHLRTATTREILVRLLRNLKAIYVQAGLFAAAASITERILLLSPQSIEERRDRGMLLSQLGRYTEAISDVQAYLRHASGATDTELVREQLKKMHGRLAMLS